MFKVNEGTVEPLLSSLRASRVADRYFFLGSVSSDSAVKQTTSSGDTRKSLSKLVEFPGKSHSACASGLIGVAVHR
jgi:hypothetical protein